MYHSYRGHGSGGQCNILINLKSVTIHNKLLIIEHKKETTSLIQIYKILCKVIICIWEKHIIDKKLTLIWTLLMI